MLRSLRSYRLTSCSNATASPRLQAWTRAMSSSAVLAAPDVELPITLAVPITNLPFQGRPSFSTPSATSDESLHHHRCSAVVAVHWPRFLLILRISNVASPEVSLTFVPSSSTRSPGFSDLFCVLVRL